MGFTPFGQPVTIPALPIGPLTGGVALEQVAPGPIIPANGAGNGLIWAFDLWGQLTTVAGADTFTWQLFLGGIAGTSLGNAGAQQPNAGGAVAGASWRVKGAVQFLSAVLAQCVFQVDMNFFPKTVGQQSTAVVTTAAQQLALGVTPSAAGDSVTVNGGYWQQVRLWSVCRAGSTRRQPAGPPLSLPGSQGRRAPACSGCGRCRSARTPAGSRACH